MGRREAAGNFAPLARRFRLLPEWCILIRRLKVPPFRRKPESHSPKANRLRCRAKRFLLAQEWKKGRNGTGAGMEFLIFVFCADMA
ncbi:MAG: hypothetical protein ACR2QC_00360 [Gammaproteobacteria bacterium]